MLLSALGLISIASSVTFALEDSGYDSVLLTGDFVGWATPQPLTLHDGDWSITFDMPADSRTEYKFVVDGEWIEDPNAPSCPNGLGGSNSYWQGPEYSGSIPELLEDNPLERTTFRVKSEHVAEREVVVYAPSTTKPLPLLILHDGPAYEQYGRAHEVAGACLQRGWVEPFVLVLLPPDNRNIEYYRDSEPFEQFFIEKLLPALRARYPISSSPRDVFVGGASLGGRISYRLARRHPDAIAGGVIAQSGAYIEEPTSMEALQSFADGIRIWIDWGSYEQGLSQQNLHLSRNLTKSEIAYKSMPSHEGHSYTAWRNKLDDALRFLLPPTVTR